MKTYGLWITKYVFKQQIPVYIVYLFCYKGVSYLQPYGCEHIISTTVPGGYHTNGKKLTLLLHAFDIRKRGEGFVPRIVVV